jgi:hypothetical protein
MKITKSFLFEVSFRISIQAQLVRALARTLATNQNSAPNMADL